MHLWKQGCFSKETNIYSIFNLPSSKTVWLRRQATLLRRQATLLRRQATLINVVI